MPIVVASIWKSLMSDRLPFETNHATMAAALAAIVPVDLAPKLRMFNRAHHYHGLLCLIALLPYGHKL